MRRKLCGRMIATGLPRPDDATYDSVVAYLETSLDGAAAAAPNPGRTDTFRRLNRTEYQNAIRDLLALDVDVSSLLPKDDASHGFDNVGTESSLPRCWSATCGGAKSPTRNRQSIALAREPHRRAVRRISRRRMHVDGLPFGTRGGTVVHHTFPLDGTYEIQVRLSRDRNENGEGLTNSTS